MKIIMKKTALILAAMLVAASVASCGIKKDTASSPDTASNTEVSQNYGTEDFSPEQVNMEKVDGTALTSSTEKSSYKGDVGSAEVSIEDAKVIELDGEDVVVVSYKYKNNSSKPMPFTGSLKVTAYQDDRTLAPTAVTGVEGVTMLSLAEPVEAGHSLTVQNAYRLMDKETPVTIEVREFFMNENSTDGLAKTFEF